VRASILTLKRARALRRKMTLPEVLLWQQLRGGKLSGLQFRRQHPIGPYILDFFCPAARLAVEVDGRGHEDAEQFAHDQRRDEWLASEDIAVLRIAAVDILKDGNMENVLARIARAAAPSTAFGGPPPP
jgi:very-short-patch-repair endonuclease